MNNDDDRKRIKKVIILLCALCLTLVIAGINRLWGTHFLRTECADILRVCDIVVVLALAPIGTILLWLLLRTAEGNKSMPVNIIFLLGIYFLGVGFGMHEPTNAMVIHYARELPNHRIIRSALFFDNDLGHWTFFAGFVLLSVAVGYAEILKPFKEKLPFKIILSSVLVGLISAGVIYANMVKEKTLVDLLVIILAVVMIFCLNLTYKSFCLRKQPIVLTIYIAFAGGVISTFIHWGINAITR